MAGAIQTGLGVRIVLVAAVVGVAGIAGWRLWQGQETGGASVQSVVADAPAQGMAPAVAPPVTTPEHSLPAAPEVETWAVTASGSMVVSGTALPDGLLRLRLDGKVLTEGRATGSGEFALLAQLAPNPAPSLVTLALVLPDGAEVPAARSMALGPIAGPEKPASPKAPDQPTAETAPPAPPPLGLMLSETGASLLPQPDTAPASGVTLQTITYAPDGAVQVGGTGQPGAAVRIYLQDEARAEGRVDGAGNWLVSLPDVAPGQYALRVDQLDASGKVSARYETPFLRETPEALALAAAPARGGEAITPPTATTAEVTPVAVPPMAPPTPQPATPAVTDGGDTPPAAKRASVTITVQPGNSLWAIARGSLGEGTLYVRVFEANRDKIRDPDLIYPGQVFTIPAP